jgi:hypothetical protein
VVRGLYPLPAEAGEQARQNQRAGDARQAAGDDGEGVAEAGRDRACL